MNDSGPLAFKVYEIEELADVYFFRPAGMIVARAAGALRMTPGAVTAVAAGVGVAGGAFLFDQRWAFLGFLLLVVHGILDSSDGQLARMTGRTSEFGRVLDGASGYVTHAAIYIALTVAARARGSGSAAYVIIAAAAIANVVHAQMYDYHRSAYGAYTIDGIVPSRPRASAGMVLAAYLAAQRIVCGLHAGVEAVISRRASGGRVRSEDRASYQRLFYWPVRGWNLLGDNTRFYAIGVLAWLHRAADFPLFVLGPMNAAFVMLWVWQARRDGRFLTESCGTGPSAL